MKDIYYKTINDKIKLGNYFCLMGFYGIPKLEKSIAKESRFWDILFWHIIIKYLNFVINETSSSIVKERSMKGYFTKFVKEGEKPNLHYSLKIKSYLLQIIGLWFMILTQIC